MQRDEPGLAAANTAFYESFERLDLDAMAAVWAHDSDVYCVHPGGPRITGWDAVRRSWAAIFAGTSYMQFIVTDVQPLADRDLGWVSCTENIITAVGGGALGTGQAMATNLFAWRDGAWRMVAHHASPVLPMEDRD